VKPSRTGSHARRLLRATVTTFAVTLLLLALDAFPAIAADGFAKDTTPLAPSVTSGKTGAVSGGAAGGAGAIARLVVGLAIVLAVVYGVYWLLKKRYGRRGGVDVADGRLELVATTALAPGRAVHLVRVADELVLVGAGEQAVSLLRAWDAAESRRLEAILAAPAPARAPTGSSPIDALRRLTVRS
jgi:flagellar protein FliO/FliZ